MASKGYLAQMRGFTLIEISIVLVVIGLLLSGGLVALGPVLQNAKRTTTENTLSKIEDALLLYAIQNSCLPCPADATAPTTEGIQANAAGTPVTAACVGGAAACFTGADAVVPWQTMGLSRSDAIDEWGTLITYHLSTDANNSTGTSNPPCDDFHEASTSNAGGFERDNSVSPIAFPQGCLNIETQETGAFTAITAQAAYVLISHGPDTSGGFSENGATRTNAYGAGNTSQEQNDAGNCDNATPCHQGDPIDLDGNNYFDDIVRWKTGPVLVFQCGDGACGNP